MKFTYIIPYQHQPDRILNLRRVIDWLSGFSGIEVIVVEQDKHSKISHINLRAKHIFIKNDGPFNKSWAYNVGLKYSNAPVIVSGDSDLIMEPNCFIRSLDELSNYEMVNPYSSVIDLTDVETSMALPDMLRINRPGRGENDHQKVPLCGGICMFRREAIFRLGGWCELFLGWGCEDNHMSLKVQNFLSYKEMPNKCYHLFHHRGSPDMNLYQRNLEILNKFSAIPKEDWIRHINTEGPKMGILNKYNG